MNGKVDIALGDRITTPFGVVATFEATADENETITGALGNISLGTSHDFLASESFVVREVVNADVVDDLGMPVAR